MLPLDVIGLGGNPNSDGFDGDKLLGQSNLPIRPVRQLAARLLTWKRNYPFIIMRTECRSIWWRRRMWF